MPPGQSDLPGVIERVRRGELVDGYQTKRLRKDGTVIAVSVTIAPIQTADGELVGVSVIGRDAAERAKLDEAAHRLAAIVEFSEDAIFSKTLDATIVSWNQGAERLYGYATSEVIGQPVSILLPPGDEDELPAIMECLRRGERVQHYETKRRRKDGSIVEVSLSISPMRTSDGQIVGASVVARDITERRQAEAARTQIARLEQVQTFRRHLLESVFETQEQERKRIARELHDEAGQLMASLLVGLRSLEDAENFQQAKAQAAHLCEIAASAIDEIGRLARGLHLSVLADVGLSSALRRYVEDYTATHHLPVDLTLPDVAPIAIPAAVQLAHFESSRRL